MWSTKASFAKAFTKKGSLHKIAGISLIFADLMKDSSYQRLVIQADSYIFQNFMRLK